ncbi:MAG: HNH endonuclease, partial [Actinomycetota bacterium]|nr:HNH endonuclease [Actinomycetota bacterium]
RMALLAETHHRAVTERKAGLRLKAYLGHVHHVAGATSARQVATAKKLRVLPEIADALELGLISFDHAALLARLCVPRVSAVMVELQPRFIELALVERFDQWAHTVRGLISLADQDGPGPGPLGEPQNRLRMTDGLDGALHLDIDLYGASAAKVRASLLKEGERQWRHQTRQPEPDTDTHRDTAQGDTEADDSASGSADGATGSDADGGSCCEHDGTFAEYPQRCLLLADGLVELIGKGMVDRANGKMPVTDVTLIVPASGPLRAWTPDGVRLQDGTIRRLLCNGIFTPMVVDNLGVPLDMGLAKRLYKPNQKKAILVRDGGCGHPGCPAPEDWCEIHHVEHWEHGGPTDGPNGFPGCSFHHDLWHSEGWSVEPDPDTHHLDQGFIIINPDGEILRSQRHGVARPLTLGLDD